MSGNVKPTPFDTRSDDWQDSLVKSILLWRSPDEPEQWPFEQ